jgi:stringent starvation protein B
MTQLLPPKKEVALALLQRSNVDVYLDPRAKGVVVPPQFKKEPRLILKIGLNMPVPIPDLHLDDESMSCTLSFNRTPFFCVVPWSSVFAMVGDDGRGMVWPDDVPQELAVRVVDEQEQPRRQPGEAEAARPPRRAKKPAAAEAAPAPARGKKNGKKKKPDAEPRRPALVAVPPAREAPVPVPVPVPARREDRVSPVPRAPAPVPASQRSGAPSSRPKRELPPYLRVVK